MFRIVCDPSSGSKELCLTEITLSVTQIFFLCLVGVWQRNFEPAVCVHGTRTYTAGSKLVSYLWQILLCRDAVLCKYVTLTELK